MPPQGASIDVRRRATTRRARRSRRCRARPASSWPRRCSRTRRSTGFPDQNAAFLEVATGRADGIVVEDYLLAQFDKSNPGKLEKAAFAEPLDVQYGSWAVPKGNEDFVEYLDEWLCEAQDRRHARRAVQEELRRRGVPADAEPADGRVAALRPPDRRRGPAGLAARARGRRRRALRSASSTSASRSAARSTSSPGRASRSATTRARRDHVARAAR